MTKSCRCNKYAIWFEQVMLYPDVLGVEPPNADLCDEIKEDYLEAGAILSKSPRGATAILRLCIQKLCKELGEAGENINNDIGKLVKRGLPIEVQQALDIVRVIGNEAVHPGQIDLKDDPQTALHLFNLINIIAEMMITRPKAIKKLYDSLPEGKRKAIEERDKPNL